MLSVEIRKWFFLNNCGEQEKGRKRKTLKKKELEKEKKKGHQVDDS